MSRERRASAMALLWILALALVCASTNNGGTLPIASDSRRADSLIERPRRNDSCALNRAYCTEMRAQNDNVPSARQENSGDGSSVQRYSLTSRRKALFADGSSDEDNIRKSVTSSPIVGGDRVDAPGALSERLTDSSEFTAPDYPESLRSSPPMALSPNFFPRNVPMGQSVYDSALITSARRRVSQAVRAATRARLSNTGNIEETAVYSPSAVLAAATQLCIPLCVLAAFVIAEPSASPFANDHRYHTAMDEAVAAARLDTVFFYTQLHASRSSSVCVNVLSALVASAEYHDTYIDFWPTGASFEDSVFLSTFIALHLTQEELERFREAENEGLDETENAYRPYQVSNDSLKTMVERGDTAIFNVLLQTGMLDPVGTAVLSDLLSLQHCGEACRAMLRTLALRASSFTLTYVLFHARMQSASVPVVYEESMMRAERYGIVRRRDPCSRGAAGGHSDTVAQALKIDDGQWEDVPGVSSDDVARALSLMVNPRLPEIVGDKGHISKLEDASEMCVLALLLRTHGPSWGFSSEDAEAVADLAGDCALLRDDDPIVASAMATVSADLDRDVAVAQAAIRSGSRYGAFMSVLAHLSPEATLAQMVCLGRPVHRVLAFALRDAVNPFSDSPKGFSGVPGAFSAAAATGRVGLVLALRAAGMLTAPRRGDVGDLSMCVRSAQACNDESAWTSLSSSTCTSTCESPRPSASRDRKALERAAAKHYPGGFKKCGRRSRRKMRLMGNIPPHNAPAIDTYTLRLMVFTGQSIAMRALRDEGLIYADSLAMALDPSRQLLTFAPIDAIFATIAVLLPLADRMTLASLAGKQLHSSWAVSDPALASMFSDELVRRNERRSLRKAQHLLHISVQNELSGLSLMLHEPSPTNNRHCAGADVCTTLPVENAPVLARSISLPVHDERAMGAPPRRHSLDPKHEFIRLNRDDPI